MSGRFEISNRPAIRQPPPVAMIFGSRRRLYHLACARAQFSVRLNYGRPKCTSFLLWVPSSPS